MEKNMELSPDRNQLFSEDLPKDFQFPIPAPIFAGETPLLVE